MKIVEFGQKDRDSIMLLHGGGLSWWNYREEANLLKEKFHVLLPVLDGHADSGAPFTTIEANARELTDYIDENLRGSVSVLGGLSLGGQILVEMLSRRENICKCAVIESALVVPMPLTNALAAPIFGMSCGLVRNRRFSELQFKSMHIRPELFEDYYLDTCKIQKQDMIRFLQADSSYVLKPGLSKTTAKAVILAGGRERGKIRRSAEILHDAIPGSELRILERYHHGEFSLNHPNDYVKLLERLTDAAR